MVYLHVVRFQFLFFFLIAVPDSILFFRCSILPFSLIQPMLYFYIIVIFLHPLAQPHIIYPHTHQSNAITFIIIIHRIRFVSYVHASISRHRGLFFRICYAASQVIYLWQKCTLAYAMISLLPGLLFQIPLLRKCHTNINIMFDFLFFLLFPLCLFFDVGVYVVVFCSHFFFFFNFSLYEWYCYRCNNLESRRLPVTCFTYALNLLYVVLFNKYKCDCAFLLCIRRAYNSQHRCY